MFFVHGWCNTENKMLTAYSNQISVETDISKETRDMKTARGSVDLLDSL